MLWSKGRYFLINQSKWFKKYGSIRKIAAIQGHDYLISYLPDYPYFKGDDSTICR